MVNTTSFSRKIVHLLKRKVLSFPLHAVFLCFFVSRCFIFSLDVSDYLFHAPRCRRPFYGLSEDRCPEGNDHRVNFFTFAVQFRDNLIDIYGLVDITIYIFLYCSSVSLEASSLVFDSSIFHSIRDFFVQYRTAYRQCSLGTIS